MDKEHVKGAAQKAKGAVEDAAGALSGNKKLQAEGKADKAEGAARRPAISRTPDAKSLIVSSVDIEPGASGFEDPTALKGRWVHACAY